MRFDRVFLGAITGRNNIFHVRTLLSLDHSVNWLWTKKKLAKIITLALLPLYFGCGLLPREKNSIQKGKGRGASWSERGECQRSRFRNPSGIGGQGQISSTCRECSAKHFRALEGTCFPTTADVSFFCGMSSIRVILLTSLFPFIHSLPAQLKNLTDL